MSNPNPQVHLMLSGANSYLSGLPNRYFQEQIWFSWANAAIKMGQSGQEIGLQMCGDAHAVLAFIAELETFRRLNPLPFKQYWVPNNAISWPDPQLSQRTVTDHVEFAKVLLSELYGMQITDSVPPDTLVVIIDPQLLSPDTQKQLADDLKNSRQPAIIITRNRQPLAKQLVKLVTTGQVSTYAFDALSPAVLPAVRDAVLTQNNVQRIMVAGAGPRLLPTAINLADLALMTQTDRLTSYSKRRAAVTDMVAILEPYTSLGNSNPFDRPYTMQEMVCGYLESEFHYEVSATANPSESQGMEFWVRGYQL